MGMLRRAVLVAAVLAGVGRAAEPGLDPAALGAAAGVEAVAASDGVVRIAWPRTDVAVTASGVRLPPAAGLTSWAAFTKSGGGSLVVSETVLFDDEVSPAVDAALAQGLAVTALADRLAFDRPRVRVLHLEGQGDPTVLATAMKGVWDAARAVRAQAAAPAERIGGDTPTAGSLDTAALEKALATPVRAENGVALASIGRDVSLRRTRLGPAQGIATHVSFVGSDALAAATGEIAMAAPEVQAVVRTLRSAGLHLTALHGHMVGETPPLYYAAFWGTGPAATLARGLRVVLDAQRAARR